MFQVFIIYFCSNSSFQHLQFEECTHTLIEHRRHRERTNDDRRIADRRRCHIAHRAYDVSFAAFDWAIRLDHYYYNHIATTADPNILKIFKKDVCVRTLFVVQMELFFSVEREGERVELQAFRFPRPRTLEMYYSDEDDFQKGSRSSNIFFLESLKLFR